jgi:hypothetical protein
MSFIDRDGMFFIVVALTKMQVAIVQVIDVPIMQNGYVTTLLIVDVRVIASVDRMLHALLLS